MTTIVIAQDPDYLSCNHYVKKFLNNKSSTLLNELGLIPSPPNPNCRLNERSIRGTETT